MKLRYWRAMYYWEGMFGASYSDQQITMLATDDQEADIHKLVAAYPTAVLELWESDTLGDEKHDDGRDQYRIHHLLRSSQCGDHVKCLLPRDASGDYALSTDPDEAEMIAEQVDLEEKRNRAVDGSYPYQCSRRMAKYWIHFHGLRSVGTGPRDG